VGSRRLARFLLLNSLYFSSVALWRTMLPLYLDYRGLDPWEVGLAYSLAVTLPMVVSVAAGALVDRAGWRLSLAASALIIGTGSFALTYASDLVSSLSLILILSFSIALFTQAGVEIVALSSESGERGFAYSLYYLSIGASTALGSSLSGFVVELAGYGILFVASSILAILAAPLALGAGEGRRERRGEWLESLECVAGEPTLVLLSAVLAIHEFSVFVCVPYIALFAKKVLEFGEPSIGLLFGVSNLAYLVSQPLAGKLADKIGGSSTLLLHLVATSLFYAALPFVKGYPEALLLFAYDGFTVSLDLPARKKLTADYAPSGRVALTSGVLDTLAGTAALPSPLLGGSIWEKMGASYVMYAGGILNLLTLLPMLVLKSRERSS